MKKILEEIKHCRERNLILFAELKEKLDIPEEYFVKNIEEVKELDIRETEKGKKVLHIDDEELEVHKMIENEGTYYVSVKKQCKFDNEIEYDLVYSTKLSK